MRNRTILALLVLIVLLTIGACSTKEERASVSKESKLHMPTDKPEDFNFMIGYGKIAIDKIDTFEGMYIKDLLLGQTAATQLKLTDEEMERIYKEMAAIDIMNYPEIFSPPYKDNPEPDANVNVTPYETYYIKIQVANQVREISWYDTNDSKAEAAVKLRNAVKMIDKIIKNKEEYMKLPKVQGE
jgi:hypothetical protein